MAAGGASLLAAAVCATATAPPPPSLATDAADALLLLRPRCSPLMALRAAACSPTAVPAAVGQPHRAH